MFKALTTGLKFGLRFAGRSALRGATKAIKFSTPHIK